MAVTIYRNTGLIGMLGSVAVKVNGKKVSKVLQDGSVEIELPQERAQLRVSQTGVKSNIVEVMDGDHVEITTSKQRYLIYFLNLICILVLATLPGPTVRLILIAFMFGLLLSPFFVKGFQLRKKVG